MAKTTPVVVNYQYAVKIINGVQKTGGNNFIFGPGFFCTSVNVHNPWRETVIYAVKTATSGFHGDPGKISQYHIFKLGPDEATEYDMHDFEFNPPDSPEGFFVIESFKPLDVVGVYTGTDLGELLGAIHLERVPAREVPRCLDYNPRYINTGLNNTWYLTNVPTNSSLNVGPAPIALSPHLSTWASEPSGTKWVGTSGLTNTVAGTYVFKYEFCLCWTFHNAAINGKLWADNNAKILLNGNQIGSVNSPTNPATISTTNYFQIGQNVLEIKVTNSAGHPSPCGVMFAGTLTGFDADCSTHSGEPQP